MLGHSYGGSMQHQLRDDLELEAATSYDFEAAQRGEITVTATFNF